MIGGTYKEPCRGFCFQLGASNAGVKSRLLNHLGATDNHLLSPWCPSQYYDEDGCDLTYFTPRLAAAVRILFDDTTRSASQQKTLDSAHSPKF